MISVNTKIVKFRHVVSAVLTLLPLYTFSVAHAADIKLQTTVEIIEEDTIFVGEDRQYHDLTRHSNTRDKYFCEGRTVEVEITNRTEQILGDDYKVFDFSLKVDGLKSTFDIINPISLQNFRTLTTRATCLDNKLSIKVIGHNSSSISNGMIIATSNIDLDSR